MKARHRRRNMDPALQKWIEDMAVNGYSASEIHRKMLESKDFVEKEKLPILRTVQNVVRNVEVRDKSGPWSVIENEPSDARIILDVLADLIVRFSRKRCFTKAEAAWVLRVKKLAPGLPHIAVWDLARSYMLAESKGESTEGLDTYLAFMPWKSKNRLGNYEYALEQGWIKEDPGKEWEWDRTLSESGWRPQQPSSPVEEDPILLRFRIESQERGGPRMREIVRKLRRIEEQNPQLAQKIKKAWDDAFQRHNEILKDWREGRKHDLTPAENKALASIWDEYHRLVDSFEEGK